MVHKDINLSVSNTRQFYKQYCSIIGTLLKLRKQEYLVLAELLLYYNEYKDLPADVRDKLVFDYDIKVKIREELNDMSSANLYNTFTALRKKGIIKNNKISSNVIVYPNDGFSLNFKWELNAEGSRINNKEQGINVKSNNQTVS